MSKVAHYLQEHLLGEVTASPEVRRHFSHDASILHLAPAIVAYPRNENDVRKTARFAWQLAERGRIFPITARGAGSDTSGAALSSGIMLVFTAHMNRILVIDAKKDFAGLEPGVTFDKLQQTLYTHGLFLPAYPASSHYATIGGGIANNAVGEKSVKYGPLSDFVKHLRVVLANGEVIETGPLAKRELNKKLGLATFEGEVYRTVDGLLEENADLVSGWRKQTKAAYNSAGYNIFDIKQKGNFDLTPLFVGSQGTLGIITEAEVEVAPYNPASKMAQISLESLSDFQQVLPKILELKPSVCDMLNKLAVHQVSRLNPNQLTGLVSSPGSAIHLFVEFDDRKTVVQKKSMKKLKKIVEKTGGEFTQANSPEDKDKIRKVRESIATLLLQTYGQGKAVPVAEDVCVPVSKLAEFLQKAGEIYGKNGLVAAAWGQAGDGVVRMHPVLDLGQIGDRQKMFKISDGIYQTVIEMSGSISAGAGDGRVKASYTPFMYGRELHEMMMKIKKACDPYGILNPGAKTFTRDQVKSLMRGEYNQAHRHEHLPRS